MEERFSQLQDQLRKQMEDNEKMREQMKAHQEAWNAMVLAQPTQPTQPTRPVKIPKPGPFAGGSPDVDDWLFKLGQYFEYTRTPDDIRVGYASMLLLEHAAVWWRHHVAQASVGAVSQIATWEEFRTALTTEFRPVNATKAARDKLADLRQTSSTQQYITEFRRITVQIPNITEEEKIDRFVRGLKVKIRQEVDLRDPKTFDEATLVADRYDTITRRVASESHGNSNAPVPMDISAIRLTESERQRLRMENRCFYCRQQGHIIANCPKKQQQQRQGNVFSQ